MKSENWKQFNKNESLLNKCLELADDLLDVNKGKDNIETVRSDKNLLNTMFQEKLKHNLKKRPPLAKKYPKTIEGKNLEQELKKTLKIYSDSVLDKKSESLTDLNNTEDFKRNFKVYGDPISKKQVIKVSKDNVELKLNSIISKDSIENKKAVIKLNSKGGKVRGQLKTSSNIFKDTSKYKKPLRAPKIENINKSLKSKPKETRALSYDIKRSKKDIHKNQRTAIKTFFSQDIMQKIRFLYYKIKSLEEMIKKDNDIIKISDINLCHEYINFLNVNYKTQSQIKILNELDISPIFYDPIEKREIKIWDLMLECGRVLCILANAYSLLSLKFENKNDLINAITCMVECSKSYKTAAYFSTAHTRQEDIGTFLSAQNLELKSEEARIIAQNLAIKKENENLFLSSQLYSGLAALLNRFQYLKSHDNIKENQIKALIYYYKGKACHLKAKALLKSSDDDEINNDRNVINYQRKANYNFINSEEIWENLLKYENQISDDQKTQINQYLAVVNEEIMENDVEIISSSEATKILDPEPFIAIPENISYCIPKFTKYLTKFPYTVIEKGSLKKVSLEQASKSNELDTLVNQKSGIGRTIKQLKILYKNGDIDINTFSELFEKYSTKEKSIEARIKELKTMKNK